MNRRQTLRMVIGIVEISLAAFAIYLGGVNVSWKNDLANQIGRHFGAIIGAIYMLKWGYWHISTALRNNSEKIVAWEMFR